MSLHKEVEFENDICAHLAAHGWLDAEGDATAYDRARALPPLVHAFDSIQHQSVGVSHAT